MDPKKTAVVLIEYQNDFTSDGGTLHGAVKDVSELLIKLLQRARQDIAYKAWLQSATTAELQDIGLKLGQQAVLLSNLRLTTPFREEDIPDWDVRYGHAFQWVDNRAQAIPWTPFMTSLQQAKVALITTAGIYPCNEKPFAIEEEEHGDPTYRTISVDAPSANLCVKHHLSLVQVGKDGDTNHLLALREARRLRDEGIIGSLASQHYSIMGYIPDTEPLIKQTAPEVAARLSAEEVNAVILTPA